MSRADYIAKYFTKHVVMAASEKSETPRTDAEYARLVEADCPPGCDSYGHEQECPVCFPERVMAKFARNLERELTAALALAEQNKRDAINECCEQLITWADSEKAQSEICRNYRTDSGYAQAARHDDKESVLRFASIQLRNVMCRAIDAAGGRAG